MVAHPRENAEKLKEMGVEPGGALAAIRALRRRRGTRAGVLLMAEIIDVDSHVYEPAALWDDFVPEADRDRVRQAFCPGSTTTAPSPPS